MKLFETKPADEVGAIRRRLEGERTKLTVLQNRVPEARDVLRRVLASGEDSSSAEANLEAVRADMERAAKLEVELSAALEEAEVRAAATAKDASLAELRAQARAAMVNGEKAATLAVRRLREFILAWGEVEAARETIDRCDRLATKKYEAALGVAPALPDKYQLVPLAIEDLKAGRMVREDLDGIGYFIPGDGKA